MDQPSDDAVPSSVGQIEPVPQPPIRSLSTVQQGQTAAATYYGATH
jgi:hypothetical protein